MRYSLRWLLVAMAYVALVVGAVVSRSTLLADAVWLVSLLSIFFAVVMASVSTGMRRTTAIGFALLSTAHIVALYVTPSRLPGTRIVSALGYRFVNSDGSGEFYVRETSTDPRGQTTRTRRYVQGSAAIVSTANAVQTMIAGWIGYGLAALAYSKRE